MIEYEELEFRTHIVMGLQRLEHGEEVLAVDEDVYLYSNHNDEYLLVGETHVSINPDDLRVQWRWKK